MIRQTNKKIFNKKIFYIVCVIIFILGLLISSLTLAFFSSKDEVTNKLIVTDVEIELIEPKWYSHGMLDAKTLEPGMIIDKNPKVLNKSKGNVYVRMRLNITDENSQNIDPDSEKYKKIISAIYFNQNGEDISNDVQLISEDGTCQNSYFRLMEDGWFYYYADNKFTVLSSGDTTPELFSYLKIPVLKSEYYGYFDEFFSIEVEAQAISTSIDETGTNNDIILKAFEEEYM